ncbi:MAG: VWA domain-containing protein [Candidatus Acidiferrales bacterium]|jgi:VWFA-related protein
MGQPPKYVNAGVMLLLLAAGPSAHAQSQNLGTAPAPASQQQTKEPPQSGNRIRTSSTVVLVPALVKTKSGETVFSLTADDFILTDNGVAQALHLETDTDSQPLALVVIVENGGQGVRHLHDYDHLGSELDAVIGDVPHLVAVVSFDSKPRIAQDFTDNTDLAAKTIATLSEGDQGAAILDALNFGIDLLRDVPPRYRRAMLLITETADNGSETSLDDAVRLVSDTNTAIYSFGFSTTKEAVKHEASKLPRPGGTPYGNEPYGAGGCMSLDPDADPDAHGNRRVQALDCMGDLLPPLRLVRMAFIAAKDGLKRNVPESVAQLTGGEYFAFTNAATLKRSLLTVSNDVPNYYLLSFRPESPSAGLHTLNLTLRNKPQLQLKARSTYWFDAEASAAP